MVYAPLSNSTMDANTQTQSNNSKKDEKKIRWRPLLFLAKIVVILSIAGFVWQFVDITYKYHRKDVVTNTVIRVSRRLILPDVSICARLTHFVNYTALESQHPTFIELIQRKYPQINSTETYDEFISIGNSYNQIFRLIVSNFKLMEIKEFLFTPQNFLLGVGLTSNTGYGMLNEFQFHEHCYWKSFTQELNICYVLSCSAKEPYVIEERDLSQGKYKGTMLSFRIHHAVFKLINDIELFFHTPGTYPRGQQNPSINIISEEYATMSFVSYSRFEINRLPWPFASDCFDYKTLDRIHGSRLDKIEKCQNDLSLQLLNTPYYGNVHSLQMDTHHGYLHYFMGYENKTVQKIADAIFDTCNKIAPQQDCTEEYYIPIEKFPRKFVGNVTLVVLRAPTRPDTILESHEKLSLTQYLILVESLLATWFGFCVAGAMPQMYRWAFTSKRNIRKIKTTILRK